MPRSGAGAGAPVDGPTSARARIRRVVLAVLAAEVVALAASGIVLLFAYRPSGAAGMGVVVEPPGGLGGAARMLHQWLGWTTPATALIAGVLVALIDREAVVRRWWPTVATILAAVAAAPWVRDRPPVAVGSGGARGRHRR